MNTNYDVFGDYLVLGWWMPLIGLLANSAKPNMALKMSRALDGEPF